MIEMLVGVGIFVVGVLLGASLYGAGMKAGEENGKTGS